MRQWLWTFVVTLMIGTTVIAEDRVNIDVRQRFQTIDHFAASDAWTTRILGQWSERNRQRVADLLFSPERGIGLSLWRFNLGAGLQPDRISSPFRTTDTFETAPGKYDFSRMPAERWMLAAAKARGVHKFIAFSYSGTARMMRNGHSNPDPGEHTSNFKPGIETEYATYLADIIEYFARRAPEKERIEFEGVSPINEPQWEWNNASQEATRASNEDIKRMIVAVHAALKDRGLNTRVEAVESGSIPDMYEPNGHATGKYKSLYGNYIDSFLGDPDVAPLMGNVISYHSYWSDGGNDLFSRRRKLREKMEAYPGWQIWQTEYCIMQHHRDLGMGAALHVAKIMHADLAIAGASAWGWWLALSTGDYKDGLLFTDWKKKGDPEKVITPKLFWAFGNFSRFIRPGMVRVGVEGVAEGAPLTSAYVDDNTGRVVVVFVNESKQERIIRPDVVGSDRPARKQVTYVTSSAVADELRRLPQTAAGRPVRLPPESVVTVVLD